MTQYFTDKESVCNIIIQSTHQLAMPNPFKVKFFVTLPFYYTITVIQNMILKLNI